MKKLATLLIFIVTISSTAQRQRKDETSTEKIPFQPFRQIGDKYYDLRPIYNFINGRDYIPSDEIGNRPMPEWIGYELSFGLSHYKIISVLKNGVLVCPVGFNRTTYLEVEGSPFFVKNYPNLKDCVDDQKIRFIALRNGTFRYESADRAIKTVPCYDCGIACDPWKKQRDLATNTPPTKP